MPRYTSAYSKFITRIEETQTLAKMGRRFLGANIPLDHQNNARVLCRAGVVLLCSHLEGYIVDVVELALERIFEKKMEKNRLSDSFFFYFSRDVVNEINQTNEPSGITSKIRNLILRDADIWSNDRHFKQPLSSARYLSNFASPSYNNIRKLIARFGCDDYPKRLSKQLHSGYPICINMIDQVVDQRNKIAHGDLVVTSTPDDLDDMQRLVKLFCRSTDDVVAAWFKECGCTLR